MSEFGGVIRALLAFAGGWMVAKGWFADAQWNELSGALMVVITAIWTIWQKRAQKAEVQKALMTPVPASNQDSGV